MSFFNKVFEKLSPLFLIIFWIAIGAIYFSIFIPEQEQDKTEPLIDPPKVEEYVPGDYKKGGEVYVDPDYQYDKDRAFRDEVMEDLKSEQGLETEYICDCSKTCDEIYTCEEAAYQLYTCGCLERNKDGDLYACDLMCEPRD
jgi:hypothetical protein